MKVLTICFDEEKGVANFYGNMTPDEANIILFSTAKQGLFKEDKNGVGQDNQNSPDSGSK